EANNADPDHWASSLTGFRRRMLGLRQLRNGGHWGNEVASGNRNRRVKFRCRHPRSADKLPLPFPLLLFRDPVALRAKIGSAGFRNDGN
ncbi:MAG TPA: hypothetical protein VFJ59_19635, partial [Pseudolabrys sp.]|nr:hypothetical protein [Pseudolabrys sp.]